MEQYIQELLTVLLLYIIRALKDSFSYGVFTSIFAVVTTLVGFYFAKLAKPKNYIINLVVSCVLTVIGILLIIIKCNFVTIIIFNLLQAYSKTIVELIISNSNMNIANLNEVKDKFKVEYFIGMETCLVVGRIVSYILLLALAFLNTTIWTNVILILFMFLIIIFTKTAIKLTNFSKDEFVENKK